MRKTVISAAALAMSTALAGLAFAAAPDGSTPTHSSSMVSPATSTTTDAPDDSDGRVGGGHGADDVIDAPDDSDGRVGGGHGADDGSGSSGHGSDDSSGHEGGDHSGSGGHGSDD